MDGFRSTGLTLKRRPTDHPRSVRILDDNIEKVKRAVLTSLHRPYCKQAAALKVSIPGGHQISNT